MTIATVAIPDALGSPSWELWSSAVVTGVRVEHHRGATTGSVPAEPCAWASTKPPLEGAHHA